MPTLLRVLSDAEISEIHEKSLAVLARTGMRIDSERARRVLEAAGAQADHAERRVRFPRTLVEASLAAAPRQFSLGGRRAGFAVPMNAGQCTLMPDGETTTLYDPTTGERRAPTRDDWANAVRLVDTMDEVGMYWQMVTAGDEGRDPSRSVRLWADVHRLFSKHIQDQIAGPRETEWLLRILETVFGSRERVRELHPFSVLFCPVSPLAMEEAHTDAYLATAGWDIPVAAMPMPMMGTSAPAGLTSTVVSGNAEVLGALCLVQAMAPGTPFLYAPALAVMEPRTGRWAGGGPEHALLGAATTEMGRSYGLPVVASNGGTDHFVAGIQSSYERTMSWLTTVLSQPDVIIGPGSLGGASTLCLEAMVIDVEVYRA
ncbi:MAG TPA: trimethylamine methyltransferase family protein, partial [Candidatus Limnocylindrales bacterium]